MFAFNYITFISLAFFHILLQYLVFCFLNMKEV